jgi:endoglycosylceramidase
VRLVALALAVAGCSAPPGWHVSGGAIRDPEGRTVLLRGLNLAGSHKAKPYFGFHEEADYRAVRGKWGMNGIRFLITWAAVEPAMGQYDEAYLDEVAKRMQWAKAADLAVVIDMHQDLFGEGFASAGGDGAPRWACDPARYAAFVPRTPWYLSSLDPNLQACVDGMFTREDLRQHFVEAWRRVAKRLAGEGAVIGFDPLNEPNWGSYAIGSFEHDRLQPLYQKVVEAVRGEAPGWLAFIEPGASRNVGFATDLANLGYANVVYSPHSYDAGAEGGGGFDPAHREQVIDNIGKLAGEAKDLGAALWIGEYGGMVNTPGIAEYMGAERDGQGDVAASAMYWDYEKNDGYGWLAGDGSEKPALVDALVAPFPERVAGDLINYSFDPVTRMAVFQVKGDGSIGAPTIVSIPEQRYPQGWTIECGGCAVEKGNGSAKLVGIGTGDARAIVVRSN